MNEQQLITDLSIDENTAKALVAKFQSWEELAKANFMALMIVGVEADKHSIVRKYAEYMISQHSATASAEATAYAWMNETQGTASSPTQPQTAVDKMRLAGQTGARQAKSDTASKMKDAALPGLWNLAKVHSTLYGLLQTKGTRFVTDEQLNDDLDTWLIMVPTEAGGQMIDRHGQRITILPNAARQEVDEAFVDFLANSVFDQILRSAAVYRVVASKAKFAQRQGLGTNVSIPNDVLDPDSIQSLAKQSFNEMYDALLGGRMSSRYRKMSAEYAELLIPAMQDRKVVTSLGVPVDDGADPFNALLNNPVHNLARLQKAMALANVMYDVFDHFALFDQMEYEQWFDMLCPIAQQYCLAIAEFQATSPQPIETTQNQFIGFKEARVALQAMITARVEVDANGGIRLEVGASASASASIGSQNYEPVNIQHFGNQESLTLRGILVTLYSDPRDAVRVCQDVGINTSRVNLQGSAVNAWHALLDEASKSSTVGKLIGKVKAEYSNHAQLNAFIEQNTSGDVITATIGANASNVAVGKNIETGGGAYIGGGVTLKGGDFVGRDKIG